MRQAEETGKSIEATKRDILAELDEETNMESFRVHVSQMLDKVRAGPTSMVPEGRAGEFPNLTFQEQLVGALAQSVDVDLGAREALQS